MAGPVADVIPVKGADAAYQHVIVLAGWVVSAQGDDWEVFLWVLMKPQG